MLRLPRFVLPIGFAAAAFAGVLWLTRPPGPGLDPDAMSYLGAAESFVRTGALRIPSGPWTSPDGTSALAHFPPGFPLALAAPLALGASGIAAARVIEALSAAVTAGLAVWLAATAAGSLGAALAGAILFLTPGLVLDHLRVLSEPLGLALIVATVALMVRAPRRPLVYGAVAALAGLVRYAGVALGGAAALWALAAAGTARQRWGRAVLAGLPTLVVQVAWALRTQAESGTVRHFGLQPHVGATLREGLDTLMGWLAPGVDGPVIRAVPALLASVLGAALVWRAARRERACFAALGLAALCYAGLVLCSRLVADAGIPLDERLLSPLFLFGGLAVAVAVGMQWNQARPAVRSVGALLLAVWLAASAWRTAGWVRDARDGGWGYAGTEWRASPLVRWLREEGAGRPIFSNSPPDVWFATGRSSWKLPESLDSDAVAGFGRALQSRGGVLVGFAVENEPMARPEELARRLALAEVARFDGATVWAPPRP